MEYVQKAVFDSVTAANANREDLSNTLTVLDGPQRPLTQNMPQVVSRNTTHQWNDIGLNKAGRNNVAALGPTYAEGNLPPTKALAPNRRTNVTCNVGRTAQVTDNEMAAFNGGGTLGLDDGQMERQIQNALDFETALVTVEVLNQIEWMHVSGDSAAGTMEGGETDGLLKWAVAGGFVVSTGGTTTTPVSFAESFLKSGGRGAALNFPSYVADTILIPPELAPDFASFIGAGAGTPVVIPMSPDGSGLIAGHQVSGYNDGYTYKKVRICPYLSSSYNSQLSQCAVVSYNSSLIRQANLIPLGAKPIAITDTSIKRAVNAVFAQEHIAAKHTYTISNVKSAI